MLSPKDLPASFHDLQLLATHGDREHHGEDIPDDIEVMPATSYILVCSDRDAVHELFADDLTKMT